MTPLLMGSGYLSGMYFFWRAAISREWWSIRLGFLPIATFATLMATATVLHWDRFNHNHITFYAWVVVYILTPVIVPAVWYANESAVSTRISSNSKIFPLAVATLLGLVGLALVLTGAMLFLAPGTLIPIWPWMLTSLTARVMGAWFILPGLIDLVADWNRRGDETFTILETQLLGLALVLVSIQRGRDALSPENLLTDVFTWGMPFLFLGVAALYGWMRR